MRYLGIDLSRVRLVPLLVLQVAAAILFNVAGGGGVAQAMGYERVLSGACGASGCIVATGSIGSGSAEDFADLLKVWRPPAGTPVILDSDGGDVIAALKLGGIIRRAGFETVIGAYREGEPAVRPATCASACAYAFLGGLRRSLVAGSRIGVHQVFALEANRLSASDAQWLTSLIAVHVNKMGASFGLLTLAMSTPPTTMRWLTSMEIATLGITTDHPPAEPRNAATEATLARLESEIAGQAPKLGAALGLGR